MADPPLGGSPGECYEPPRFIDHHQRQVSHRRSPKSYRTGGRHPRRQVSGGRQRRRSHAARRAGNPGDRPAWPHRHSGPERLAPAPDPRRPELQPGAALGRRAFAGRRAAHVKRAGAAHAEPAMGAGGRRLDRIPVCRTPHANAGRNQPGGAGHAGIYSASLRSRAAQPRGAEGGRLHQRHAEPTGRRDPARRQRQPDRHADRQTGASACGDGKGVPA